MTTPKTRREELALEVLQDAISVALHLGRTDGAILSARLRLRSHNRLLKVLRYYGKPVTRKPRGVSKPRPGANTEAVFDREGT